MLFRSAKDPNNEYMQRMVMLNEAALENWPAAEAAGQKLFAHKDAKFTATDYSTYGEVLGKLGKPTEAVAAYESAYELNPEKNKQMLAEISEMYNKLENDSMAVAYMQKYVDLGDASLTDYYVLSNRYKNLALTRPEGSPERAEAASNGIKYIDLALADAANKGPLYRNKAALQMIRDGKPTPEVMETYEAMLAAFDENPDNKEKYADVYKNTYTTLGSFYMTENPEKAKMFLNKALEMDPENEGLKKAIEKL